LHPSASPPPLPNTLNGNGASTSVVNVDLLPLVEKLADKLKSVRRYVLLSDRAELPTTRSRRPS
jgi:hypothetical protein